MMQRSWQLHMLELSKPYSLYIEVVRALGLSLHPGSARDKAVQEEEGKGEEGKGEEG